MPIRRWTRLVIKENKKATGLHNAITLKQTRKLMKSDIEKDFLKAMEDMRECLFGNRLSETKKSKKPKESIYGNFIEDNFIYRIFAENMPILRGFFNFQSKNEDNTDNMENKDIENLEIDLIFDELDNNISILDDDLDHSYNQSISLLIKEENAMDKEESIDFKIKVIFCIVTAIMSLIIMTAIIASILTLFGIPAFTLIGVGVIIALHAIASAFMPSSIASIYLYSASALTTLAITITPLVIEVNDYLKTKETNQLIEYYNYENEEIIDNYEQSKNSYEKNLDELWIENYYKVKNDKDNIIEDEYHYNPFCNEF